MAIASTMGPHPLRVFLIAVLVLLVLGFIAPFFQDSLNQRADTSPGRYLEELRDAIIAHDMHYPALQGTSLNPLRDTYPRRLLNDPWGHHYLCDLNVGFLGSFGADGKPGGVGADSDFGLYYKSSLRILRARLQGAWGVPRRGTKLYLWFGKPYLIVWPRRLMEAIQLSGPPDVPVSLRDLKLAHGHSWHFAGDPHQQQLSGLLVLEANLDADAGATPLCSGQLMTFDARLPLDDQSTLTRFGIREFPASNGPLDPAVHGPGALAFLHPPATGGDHEIGLPQPAAPARLASFVSDSETTAPMPDFDSEACHLIPQAPPQRWIGPSAPTPPALY